MSQLRSTEAVLQYAEDNNLDVFIPGFLEIQLDLDTAASIKEFKRRLGFFRSIHPCMVSLVEFTTSRNGGTHVYITLNKSVTALERIGLQAILGSDAKREILSLKDYFEAQREPTLFFELKGAKRESQFIPASQGLYPLESLIKRIKKAWKGNAKRSPVGNSSGSKE